MRRMSMLLCLSADTLTHVKDTCERQALVGADVMTTTAPHADQKPDAFFRDFENCLTALEWTCIRNCESLGDAALYRAFFVFWCVEIRNEGLSLAASCAAVHATFT